MDQSIWSLNLAAVHSRWAQPRLWATRASPVEQRLNLLKPMKRQSSLSPSSTRGMCRLPRPRSYCQQLLRQWATRQKLRRESCRLTLARKHHRLMCRLRYNSPWSSNTPFVDYRLETLTVLLSHRCANENSDTNWDRYQFHRWPVVPVSLINFENHSAYPVVFVQFYRWILQMMVLWGS